jgi:hypothetical protein
MFPSTQAYKAGDEPNFESTRRLASLRGSIARWAAGLPQLLAIIVQFGLIVMVINFWQLESVSLGRLVQLAFVGFVIHHLLPSRFRLAFFAILSLVAIIVILGEMGPRTWLDGLTGKISLGNFLYYLVPGLTLIAIGLGLIGLCHLPIRFAVRVGLLALVGAVLMALRVHNRLLPEMGEMWVILGSMFMFRLMVYLYDLKHRTAPFSPARSISYFFLFPNICFPLFPLVDYKTFCTTYYNEDWVRVYQTGLKWMLRGVFQLLLYRVVYQLAPLDVSQLSSSAHVVGFMVGTYLLYLRISGTFHLIVGLLHMFGFNLPETHHLYLLSSSFTDFWRRINIYWKDFIMKLFFYPTHFALRKMGTLWAMSVATLVTFFATWLLHSWQWYWIRGSLLLTWQDIFFWGTLALLVLINGLYEATWGQRRKLKLSQVTVRERLTLALQAIGTFIVMCTLWTVWSCQSWDELRVLADAASRPSLREIAIILAGLAIIGACSMVWGRSSRETSEGRSAEAVPFHFWRSAATVGAGAICLMAAPKVIPRVIPDAGDMMARLSQDVLNARDMKMQRRGYYEDLDAGRADTWRWRQAKMAEIGQGEQLGREGGEAEIVGGWGEGKKVFYRDRPDFLLKEIVPSVSTILGGAVATSNCMGMRDREYQKLKPANTYRLVLLGSSHEQGTGVKEDQTYENLVEDSLNKDLPSAHHPRYEILNLSVGGYSILQKLLRLEQEGFGFQPDAAILATAAVDQQFLVDHLRKALVLGREAPSNYKEFLAHIVQEARIDRSMPNAMIERRLLPCVAEIDAWAFHRFARVCAEHGVRPLVLYRPAPVDFEGLEPAGRSEVIHLARAAGIEVIDLTPAFASVSDRSKLILAEWDHHTNALGHRLLADKLYEILVPLLQASADGSSADRQAARK